MTATRRLPAAERQDPVVLDQDQGPLRERPGGACLVRGQGVEGGLVRHRDVRLVEQPEPELHPEHPRDRRIEVGLADPAVLEGRLERRPEGDRARQLRVHAGDEGQPRRLAQVGRQMVGARDHLDADVVRGDDPVEAPLVAEDPGQQLRGTHGTGRHPRRSRPA